MPLITLFFQRVFPSTSRRRAITACLAVGASSWLSACEKLPGGGRSAAPAAFAGIDITGADHAQGFALKDFNGVPRTLSDYQGKVVMLYFGFVQCPDVCPTALTRAVEVLRLLGAEAGARLQVLFVTVDLERDTPALLRDYMAAFDPSFVALTGSLDQIKATAEGFRAYFKKVPTGSTYTMDHTALTYLFDPKGQVRVVLRHEQTAADHAADVQRLLAEPSV
jgi:protein SCO1